MEAFHRLVRRYLIAENRFLGGALMPTPIDREKLLSIGVLSGRSRYGKNFSKSVTDELGNTVTEHWNDRQDVIIRPQVVQSKTSVKPTGE
jgi:hypothetical protein